MVGLNQRLFEYASPGFDPSDMAQEEAIFTGILKQQNPNDSNGSHQVNSQEPGSPKNGTCRLQHGGRRGHVELQNQN